MNIPRLPSRFRQGDRLRASDLNLLLDWAEAVQKILPSLRVSTGPNLEFSRGSNGTTISLARGFAQSRSRSTADEHPFKVSAAFDEAGTLRIRVAPGQYWNYARIYGGFAAQNQNLESPELNVELSAATTLAVRLACETTSITTEDGNTIQKSAGTPYLTTDDPPAGYFHYVLAYVAADPSTKAVSVNQQWRSDAVFC